MRLSTSSLASPATEPPPPPGGGGRASVGTIDLTDVEGDLAKFESDSNVAEALSNGIDLRKYAEQVDERLREADERAIADYVAESDNVAQLFHKIDKCDGILERMESMLRGFQTHLGTISSEIRKLQDDSLSMNVKLRNRKAVESKLSKFIDGVAFSEDLVRTICEGGIDGSFIDALVQLNSKLVFICQASNSDAVCAREAQKHLVTLKLKAVARIRVFLMQSIHALQKPKTNIQIKQNVMLKLRYLMEFTIEHAEPVAVELRSFYCSTLANTYSTFFRAYLANMSRLRAKEILELERGDVLGVDPSRSRGLFAAKKEEAYYIQAFQLGARDNVLQLPEEDPIIYHIAQQNRQKFSWHETFRSSVRLLVNTAASEYLFTSEFFCRDDLFKEICSKTISQFEDLLHQYVVNCFDAIGILLIIRILQQQRTLMNRRRVVCLDDAFDRMNMLLWPRFKLIFDDNLSSLQSIDSDTSQSVEPHYVIRRYAHYCTALAVLNTPYNDEIVCSTLQRLGVEIEALLLRMASSVSVPKNQIILLINNYSHILSVLRSRNVQSKDTTAFEELLSKQTLLYVVLELKQSETFGRIVSFVKQSPASSSSTASSFDPGVIDSLARGFGQGWKDGIAQLVSNIERDFSAQNEADRLPIVKAVLTQLLTYYQRYHDIAIRYCSPTDAVHAELVSVQTMVYEIKKHLQS